MPATAKPRKTSSARSTSRNNGSAAKRTSGPSRAPARGNRSTPKPPAHESIGVGTIAVGAAAGALGTAVAALAGRALIGSRTRRKRVLGVSVHRSNTSVKSVAKQFAGMAERLEQKSGDISKASGRAKQAAKVLS